MVLDGHDGRYAAAGVEVTTSPSGDALEIGIACPDDALSWVGLRWHAPAGPGTQYLGDAWERSYGDLQWRRDQPERLLPWYFLAFDAATVTTDGWGVRVRPGAFCSWRADVRGVTLWLDVRGGGSPVRLGERTLTAATVVRVTGGDPWQAGEALVAAMCDDPLPSHDPVLGANNWYYAYGENFGPAEVLRDADTIVGLAGAAARPFCVVDAGWSPGGHAPGGPWDAGTAGLFDDMPGLAADIAARGARPGIWFRPAALSTVADPSVLRAGPRESTEQPLDLSRGDNLAQIAADVRRLVGWGFELLKHDFSTYDHFGRFGPAMGSRLTEEGWSLADPTRTNAEVLVRCYETIRAAAGAAVVMGCNTVGHLAAGLVDIQRTGDDTSGRDWERTRRMGVNTLAFRLSQHRRFFTVDADCVPCTTQTPWQQNRQFAELIARSGTALFLSIDPAARTPAVDSDLRAILALHRGVASAAPLRPDDWLSTTTPRHWHDGSGSYRYDWDEPAGVPIVGG